MSGTDNYNVCQEIGRGVQYLVLYPPEMLSLGIPRERNFMKKNLNFHIFNGTISDICYEIYNSNFFGYTSIVVSLQRDFVKDPSTLAILLRAIRHNKYLRYKLKFISFCYDEETFLWVDIDQRWYHFMQILEDSEVEEGEGGNTVCRRCCRTLSKPFNPEIYDRYKDTLIEDRRNAYQRYLVKRDYDCFHSFSIDNTIFMQTFPDPPWIYDIEHHMWQDIYEASHMSLQEFLNSYNNSELRRRFVQTSTSAELYAYKVNPALLMVNEMAYFSKRIKCLNSIELDIVHTQGELQVAEISDKGDILDRKSVTINVRKSRQPRIVANNLSLQVPDYCTTIPVYSALHRIQNGQKQLETVIKTQL